MNRESSTSLKWEQRCWNRAGLVQWLCALTMPVGCSGMCECDGARCTLPLVTLWRVKLWHLREVSRVPFLGPWQRIRRTIFTRMV